MAPIAARGGEVGGATAMRASRGISAENSGSPRRQSPSWAGAESGIGWLARGWESKSVEAQQDAAQAPASTGTVVTREEAARKTQRATLMLARTRALADLQAACVPAHRAMLEQAVADLDRRLAALDNGVP
jgi:hypothetical protein